MLFNLLLASITIILYFLFLFPLVFNNVFTIPVVIENAKLKLALAIPTGAPITVANDAIDSPSFAADKTIKDLSKYSKETIYLLKLLLISSLSLISPIK